ncbi:MAG: YfhO family protein [Holophagales bacterium]|nr:YfhO family protein [Holophagales bacterium]
MQDAFGRAFLPSRPSGRDRRRSLRGPESAGFDPGRVVLVAPPPEGSRLPPPRGPGSWAAVRFLVDEPERAELSTTASTPSLLVLTRTWDPGWSARIDGVPVPLLRAQIALLAVIVPVGEHRVELAYRPVTFRIGLGLSAAGLLTVLALALAGPPGGRGR